MNRISYTRPTNFNNSWQKELQPPSGRVIEQIRQNLREWETAFWRLSLWDYFPNFEEPKTTFYVVFDSQSGAMRVNTHDLYLHPDQDLILKFTYDSDNTIGFERETLISDAKKLEIKFSITALKILLVIEKLLKLCHKGQSNQMGNAFVEKNLQTLLEDQTSKKIIDVWKSTNDPEVFHKEFDTSFLTGLFYQTHKEDRVWKKRWKSLDIFNEEFLVVVSKNDRRPRFGYVHTVCGAENNEFNTQVVVERFVGSYLGFPLKNGEGFVYLTIDDTELPVTVTYRLCHFRLVQKLPNGQKMDDTGQNWTI